jgi:uncharacterized membrane protein
MLFPKQFVYFGVLHCIAVTSLAGLFFVGKPKLSFLFFLLFIIPNLLFKPTLIPISEWLGVDSIDYIPFFPWFGLVLAGITLESIHFHRLPFKKVFPVGFFETLGKHSLKIYLIHRPVVFGIAFSLYKLKTSS